jgi:hypothetical protein
MRLSNLHVTDRQVFDALTNEIRSWEEKGRMTYEVRTPRMQQILEAKKFHTRIDSLAIQLREHQEFRSKDQVAKRTRERQEKLKKLGQVDAGGSK